jgi:capsule polysaccharide modification protein KpsS
MSQKLEAYCSLAKLTSKYNGYSSHRDLFLRLLRKWIVRHSIMRESKQISEQTLEKAITKIERKIHNATRTTKNT